MERTSDSGRIRRKMQLYISLSQFVLSVFLSLFQCVLSQVGLYSYTCFYLWTLNGGTEKHCKWKDGQEEENCVLCLKEVLGSVNMFFLRYVRVFGGQCLGLIYHHSTQSFWISSPAACLRKNCVCKLRQELSLSSSHHFTSCVCFSVSISVSGSEWAHESMREGWRRGEAEVGIHKIHCKIPPYTHTYTHTNTYHFILILLWDKEMRKECDIRKRYIWYDWKQDVLLLLIQ